MIGKLQRVPLRTVWKHEAYDFTTWLEDNLDVLDEALDAGLTGAEREQAAGSFSVDLIAEDSSGNVVVIENQLGRSDHDHLGKVLTYLTAYEARTAVWIVADPRPEHVKAVAWLNESTVASFYLFKVEAVQIGDSPPAPLLTPIVGPSEEAREVGKTKKELSERHVLRQQFWTSLLEKAKERTSLHANISPGRYNWVGTSAGKSGLNYNYSIRQHDAVAELYIDRGKEAHKENEFIFGELRECKEEIETSFGEPLEWQRLDEKRACRIKKEISTGGYRDESDWAKVQDEMIGAMIRLERALAPHIEDLHL